MTDIQDWLDEHQAPQKIGGTILYVRSDDVRELFAEQEDELKALESALRGLLYRLDYDEKGKRR